jgi:hypothetical protein
MPLHRETRLEQFIQARGVNIAKVLAEMRMQRTQFNRYRFGHSQACEHVIVRTVLAFRRVLGEPIRANQLFYLGDDEDSRG